MCPVLLTKTDDGLLKINVRAAVAWIHAETMEH